MRNIIAGCAALGLAAVATITPAGAHTLSAPGIVQPSVQQARWNECGPRCQEQRREIRQHELARERMAQHHRWEEQRHWHNDYRHAPAAYGYQRY
jgi:hypothetical protein